MTTIQWRFASSVSDRRSGEAASQAAGEEDGGGGKRRARYRLIKRCNEARLGRTVLLFGRSSANAQGVERAEYRMKLTSKSKSRHECAAWDRMGV
jgi:hypothetical protein